MMNTAFRAAPGRHVSRQRGLPLATRRRHRHNFVAVVIVVHVAAVGRGHSLKGRRQVIKADSSCRLFISSGRLRELLKLLLLTRCCVGTMTMVVMSVMMMVVVVMMMPRTLLFVRTGSGAGIFSAGTARNFAEIVPARVGRCRVCCRSRQVGTSENNL